MFDEKALRTIADVLAALNRLTEENADWPENLYLEVKLRDNFHDKLGVFSDELGTWLFEPRYEPGKK